ncbi:MAG TPA: proline--tRNA ligase [Acidimicrobiales bacterium]|nr:proline--tRNA ligase [Acidimicrobiales bacterium]
MRMSRLFVRTLRDDPTDADVASHKLLVRAGYVRRAAPGIYSWLPLGWMVLRNVERVVREEMERAGFQEVHFPALLPREPYDATGRWTEYGDNLFRLRDRRGADYLLGPTHEEMFTLLVKDMCGSYKDLPLSLFQIQMKYRDEARPRAGLLRGREFLMKDSYSFDLDEDGLQASYAAHRHAYIRTFDRLGLPYVIVAATSGAMGGSASEEFLAPLDAGEDTFVQCQGCDYAANIEAARTGPGDATVDDEAEAAHIEETPGTGTIESLVAHLNSRPDIVPPDGRPWASANTLKNVLVMLTHPDGRREPLAVGLPGDRGLDLRRLEAHVAPAEVTPFTDNDFSARPQLARGYIGPGVLGEAKGIRYLIDPRVMPGSAWVTGADIPDRHVVGLVAGRDFTADGTVDAAELRYGDPCPDCGQGLDLRRGIELGHIFQLGRKYAESLDLTVAGPEGRSIVVTMGSYGIGISRAVAAIAEATLDHLGLCWPREVAPADAHVVSIGTAEGVRSHSENLVGELVTRGVRVLHDDRPDASPGVKLKDAELIGIPTIVVIGKKLADDVVEVRDRRSGRTDDVPTSEAVQQVLDLCGSRSMSD